MHIRTATPDDIPQIAGLIGRLAEHDGVEAPDTKALAGVLRTLLTRKSCVYVLAEIDGGCVVGTMQLDFRLTTWEAAPYVYVEDFFVAEEQRGQGVGSDMLEFAKRLAAERGCVRMDLDVLEDSADARRFYARHGFVDQQRRYLRFVLNR